MTLDLEAGRLGRRRTTVRFGVSSDSTHVSESLDRAAAELFAAFDDHDLRAILFNGPTVSTWLYSDAAARPYGDLDVLVSPAETASAERVLASLGFTGRVFAGERGAPSSRIWTRELDGSAVDLHDRLVGADVGAGETWDLLSVETESMSLGGGTVRALQPFARAFVLALSAAEKGAFASKAVGDLALGIEQLPPDTWRRSAALAGRLGAEPAFAAGLRLVPRGSVLVASLELEHAESITVRIRAEADPAAKGGALAIAWIREQPSWIGRVRAAGRVLVPSPAAMRDASAVSRRGRAGLVAGYVWRLAVVSPRKLLPAIRAYLLLRRRSR